VEITLIDKQQEYFYNMASPRAILSPEFADKMFFKLDNVLQGKGNVVHGTVKCVNKEHVLLEDGSKYQFDYLVVASGASYPGPFKLTPTTKQEGLMQLKKYGDEIKNAEKIVVIGGGAVGLEVAAEIKEAYPEKSLTVVQADSHLLSNDITDSVRSRLLAKVKSLKINVILNERINLENLDLSKRATLVTEKGTKIESDYCLNCIGRLVPNSQFLDDFKIVDAKGFVNVKPTLQFDHKDFSNMFALGDVANTGAAKTAYMTYDQAKVVAANIYALVNNGKMKEYKIPKNDFFLLTLGSNDGFANLPYVPLFIGNYLSVALKSKDFFSSKSRIPYHESHLKTK
jgi:NADH dehydrogenase FAD-containing subunit